MVRSSTATERSNNGSSFAQTCNLLSQFLKSGKANLGDISLAAKLDHSSFKSGNCSKKFAGTPTTTLNLLPSIGNDDASRDLISPSAVVESLPQFGSPATEKSGSAAAAQMTIFYGGRVIVFDDFPAEKAKEIMDLASGKGGVVNNSNPSDERNVNSLNTGAASSSSSPDSGGQIERLPFRPPQPIPSDLPIARRASLHRFLEKRKDRVTSRGPYHFQGNPESPAAGKAVAGSNANPWLDRQMSQSSKQLELSL
ncbi:Protein TIFY 10B [Linum perenne]